VKIGDRLTLCLETKSLQVLLGHASIGGVALLADAPGIELDETLDVLSAWQPAEGRWRVNAIVASYADPNAQRSWEQTVWTISATGQNGFDPRVIGDGPLLREWLQSAAAQELGVRLQDDALEATASSGRRKQAASDVEEQLQTAQWDRTTVRVSGKQHDACATTAAPYTAWWSVIAEEGVATYGVSRGSIPPLAFLPSLNPADPPARRATR
jgi:hypothetical protein